MVGVVIVADQSIVDILEGIPIFELVKIIKASIRSLSNKESRAMHVRKNKVYNPLTLKK